MPTKKTSAYLLLFVHIIALIIHHNYGYLGHYGYDDLNYARLANGVVNGIVDFEDHFFYRFSIIFPTALSYFLFGVSDFSSAVPALLTAALILFIVFSVLKKKDRITLSAGLSLTTFSSWFFFYSDKLMPDLYVAFSVILSLFFIWKYKFESDGKQPALYAFLLALSFLFGFMAKGTILLVLPLPIILAVIDFSQKKNIKFWMYSGLAGVLLLGVYFGSMRYLTGDFTARFDAIAGNSYLNFCSYDKQPVAFLLKRISYEFFNQMTRRGMMFGFIFVFAFFSKKKFNKFFELDTTLSFFSFSALTLLLSSNFMTISPTAYVPMCLDSRHYLFLIPVTAIPGAIIFGNLIKNKNKNYTPQVLAFAILAATHAFFIKSPNFQSLYLPFAALLCILYFLKINKATSLLLSIFFTLVLLIEPFKRIKYARTINYTEQREFVQNFISEQKKPCIIVTNEVQRRFCNYYQSFDNNALCKFVSYEDYNSGVSTEEKTFLLKNWYTNYLSGKNHEDLPVFAKDIISNQSPVVQNKKPDISIFEIKRQLKPITKELEIFRTFNSFEKELKFWNNSQKTITAKRKYEGEKSNHIDEFSAAFSFPTDSLLKHDIKKLILSGSVFCNFDNKTRARLIISVEKNGESSFWEGQGVNKFLKAYANWSKVEFETSIETEKLKKNSMLKVYLWNPDKQSGYIDNFEISIIEGGSL